MAYDEHLAARIRELIAAEEGFAERKMFGGLAFLIDGNMAVAASGQGGLMVRAVGAPRGRVRAHSAGEAMSFRSSPGHK
jgi:TfoX/Sxy family transcriptional regulator of competence genes